MPTNLGKAAAAAALLSLAASPAIAASAPQVRANTPMEDSEHLTSPPIIAVIGLVAIIGGGVWLAVDGDETPDSP